MVSRKLTTLLSSSSASPSLGIAVPGLAVGGSLIHCLRNCGSLGKLSYGCDAICVRLGPTVPRASGRLSIVWQAVQPFVSNTCLPTFASPSLKGSALVLMLMMPEPAGPGVGLAMAALADTGAAGVA